jgi:putative salt-induced outer membrane protein
MTIKNVSVLGGVMITAVTGAAFADEANIKPKPWKGDAELGIVATSGNTTTQSITARGGVTYEQANWRHIAKIDILNSSSDNITTAERYTASGKSDYKIDARSFVFGRIGYESDRFAGFYYRTTETAGYGYRLIDAKMLTLDLEAGPGARQTKFRSGDSTGEAIGRVASLLTWKISDTATFTEDLSSDIGQDTTITKSVTALKAQVTANLAMKATLTVRNISNVPVGVKNTDSETGLTLVYGF